MTPALSLAEVFLLFGHGRPRDPPLSEPPPHQRAGALPPRHCRPTVALSVHTPDCRCIVCDPQRLRCGLPPGAGLPTL